VASVMQEARDGPVDPNLKDESTETKGDLKSSTQSSKMRSGEWKIPPLDPLAKVLIPCRRVKASCWLPGSRMYHGRYANSPGPQARGQDELAKLSYISLQSIDGRGMRVETPESVHDRISPSNGPSFRWKPWVHCTTRPP
jgi:hypothetical protein